VSGNWDWRRDGLWYWFRIRGFIELNDGIGHVGCSKGLGIQKVYRIL